MNIPVRLATPADAAALISLNKAFDDGDNVAEALEYVQQSLRDHPTEVVFVASVDNNLVGFATLQLTHSFCYERPTAELTGLFVNPLHRRQGIASALLQTAKKHCESHDGLELFLRVNRQNQNAIQCYQANGFAEAEHYEYRIKYYA